MRAIFATSRATCRILAIGLTIAGIAHTAGAEDRSNPATLQFFEAHWTTIEDRQVDLFYAGYGAMWLPPPSRADSGDGSVGYDVYDRFDLGRPRKETLYGTQTSLKTLIGESHNASVNVYTDLLLNHNGFSDLGTVDDFGTPDPLDDVTFAEAGGYPGFAITLPGDIDGDFHGAFEGGDLNMRLAGLVDIAQEKTHQFIRHPVAPGDPNNIPAGTAAAFGRLANVPDPDNARFYPDQGLGGIQLDVDPGPGEFLITRHDFNLADPMQGDATIETAENLLMRHAQWMIQVIGVDGFRIDAAKHFPESTLDLLDQAVFRASNQLNHDGSIKPTFSFSEVLDGNKGFLQTIINKGLSNPDAIDPADFEVQGNRDVLDFPLFFGLRNGLQSDVNSDANNWHAVRDATQDTQDDSLRNGSQGVSFVGSHDNLPGGFPVGVLDTVAHAYTLLRPGDAIVYFNGKEFGDGRPFPNDGRDDALGGPDVGDDAITTLVNLRNTHGRGDFRERWIDEAFGDTNGDGQKSNIYVYERSNSVIVGLSNRVDAVVETRNGVDTDFAEDTILVELTGNAANATVDPGGVIPETIKVGADGFIDLSIPGNDSHGLGYVIYGLATPQGTLSLSDVSFVLAGGTPTPETNGTTRLGDIDVITSDAFDVTLNTTAVELTDPVTMLEVRDFDADGDTALIRIDQGMDLNNLPGIDNATPGGVAYAFEQFTDTNTPGYIDDGNGGNIGTGSGAFVQTIDATQLDEGRHFITVRAFRHRDDGGPAVFTDFKRVVYVDRLPPEAEVVSFEPFATEPGEPENRDLIVRSVDQTADNMHIFLDLPASLTDAQVLQMALGGQNDAGEYDRDQWIFGFFGVETGNHVATVVTFESSFNQTFGTGYNVQRFAGLFTADTGVGAGLGDTDFDDQYTPGDINLFDTLLQSGDTLFNPAADLDGDGLIGLVDLDLLAARLDEVNADAPTQSAYQALLDTFLLLGDANNDGQVTGADLIAVQQNFGNVGSDTGLQLGDANDDGQVTGADLIAVQQNFGAVLAPASGSVPEPTTLAILLAAALLATRRRPDPLQRVGRPR